MKLYTYTNGHAKRRHSRANLTVKEIEELLKVSDEWELVEVKGNLAIFKSVKHQ